LINGYKRSAFWFEVFECVRKLAMVCMPVFFTSGSAEQLMFGLIVCFITFGIYAYHVPYTESKSNFLAQMCQCQIFFALLSSVALKFAAEAIDSAGARLLDYVLTTLTLLPGVILTVFQSPASRIFDRDFRVQAVDWIYLRFPCLQRKATLQQRERRASLYMTDRNSRASRTSCVVASEAIKAQDKAQSLPTAPSSGKLVRSLTTAIPAALLTSGEHEFDKDDEGDKDNQSIGLPSHCKRLGERPVDLSERSHRRNSVYAPSSSNHMDDDTRGSRLAEALEKAQARGSFTNRDSATTRRTGAKVSFREGQLHTGRSGTVEAPPRQNSKQRHHPAVAKQLLEQRQARGGTHLPAPVQLPAGTHINTSCEHNLFV